MQRLRRACPPSHAVLQLLPHLAEQGKTPHAAADDGISALLRPAPCFSTVHTPTPAPMMCVTCFAAAIADLPGSVPLSSNDVRRGANAIMETLAAGAPDIGEDALQAWACALLRFDDVLDDTAAAPGGHETGAGGSGGGGLGSALADLVVRLFAYAARDMSVRARAIDALAPHKTARPQAKIAVEDVNARWVVLIDLAQLLFSCWELLLQLAPATQPDEAVGADGGSCPWSALLGPRATAEAHRSPTASTMATLVLGEALGGFTDTEVHSAAGTVRGGSADPVAPHPQPPFGYAVASPSLANVRVAQSTAAGLHSLVARLLAALCAAADADAAVLLSHAATTTSSLQMHEAVLSFHKLCHHVPLLRRLLEASPHHLRCLSRCILPRLLVLRDVPARAPVTHVMGKSNASQSRSRGMGRHWAACSVATALCALLSILHGVVTAAAGAAAQPGNAAALTLIASQLTGPGDVASGSGTPVLSPLAERDGAPLLHSLLHALHLSLTGQLHRHRHDDDNHGGDGDDDEGASSTAQLHERLRLQVLRLVNALCRWPPTREALLLAQPLPHAGVVNAGEQQHSGPGGLDKVTGACAGPTASSTWTLMKALTPLLLATDIGAHHAELTALTCEVLQTLLLSEGDGSVRGNTAEDEDGNADAARRRGSEQYVLGVRPACAAAAPRVSSVAWTTLVAERLSDYAALALNLCWMREAAEPLVGLLECAACTMHRARRVLPLLVREEEEQQHRQSRSGAALLVDVGAPADAPLPPPWQSQQDWRVVFRVAALDVGLFERLVRGPVLHDALRGRQLNWDDVVDAIEGVVTSVPPAGCPAPSFFALLRCLEALAEGMGRSAAGMWSSRLQVLLHEVLARVERVLCGAAASSAAPPSLRDAAGAMQAWVALVTGRVLLPDCDDHDKKRAWADVRRAFLPGVIANPSGSSMAASLQHALHPSVHRLLLRVVALHLPIAANHLLHPLGVLLLSHYAATRELVTLRCASSLDDPSTRPAALEESRCLLQVAATLMDSLYSSWSCLLPPHPLQTNTSVGCAAVAVPAPPHFAPLESAATQNTGDGLLDSLFALYPSAPDTQEARAALLQALLGRPATLTERVDTAPYMCAASLADIAGCETNTQSALLLSLASLGCRPPVAHDVLVALLQRRCLRLHRLVEVWSSGGDADAMANAPLAAGAEENGLAGAEEDCAGSGREAGEDTAGSALDASATTNRSDRCLLDELQIVLHLLVARTLWFATEPQLAALPRHALLDDEALHIFSGLDARVILSHVAAASDVQRGLCQQLAHLQTRHRVDGRSLLECFGCSDARSADTEVYAAGRDVTASALSATVAARHGPSAILFAAAVMSAVLCSPAQATSTDSCGRLTGPCLLLPDVRHSHNTSSGIGGDSAGATDASAWHCVWSYPRALLLTALFLRARGEVVRHLHGLWQPQEALPQPRRDACAADCEVEGERGEASASQRCLEFVAAALCFSNCACGLPTACLVATGPVQWRRRAVLAMHVARDHLLPLMLHRGRHGQWRDTAPLTDHAVVAYTVALVQLWCAALFLLAPVVCAFADAALAAYAADRVAQLQALPADELASVVTGNGPAAELLRPLLQLLYLLLVRPSRGEVVRLHGGDITLFTLRVRSAAVALLRPREAADVAAAMPTDACVDVCVMASLTYLQAWRAMSGASGIGDGGLHAHTLAGAAAVLADEVGEAGTAAVCAGEAAFHASPPLLPWYGWVPVFRLHRLFTAAATDATRATVGRARCVALAGFEAALRLCGRWTSTGQAVAAPPHAPPQGGSRRPRGWASPSPPPRPTPQQLWAWLDGASVQPHRRTPDEERFAAALVLDWCAQFLLFAAPHHRHARGGVRGEGRGSCGGAPVAAEVALSSAPATMLVVAARLLYLLVHRYGTTLQGSLVLDSLALQLLHPAGPWRNHDFPVLAAGWGLAAALSLLCDPVACITCVQRARACAAEFLQRPEVATRVHVPGQRQQPHPTSARDIETAPYQDSIPPSTAVRPEVPAPTASTWPPPSSARDGAAGGTSEKGQGSRSGAGAPPDAAQREIDAIVRVLLALDVLYERHGQEQRRGTAAAATLVEFALLPPGTRLIADEEVAGDCFMQESVCSPYVVSASVEGAPPLLLWLCDLTGGHSM